jgi:ABC-type nitrate/sulfonate/bicarbonate transport system ATPase subunit
VTLTYGEGRQRTPALAETSLRIDEGEFVAVVGPSGCGKSSLLKLVSGLLPATSGNIIVAQREVNAPIKIVGMAFQNPNLLPWRTVIDNVLLPLEIVEPHRHQFRQRRREFREQARALLATVGLDGFGERYPWELSGGMQQRVAICRALVHDPGSRTSPSPPCCSWPPWPSQHYSRWWSSASDWSAPGTPSPASRRSPRRRRAHGRRGPAPQAVVTACS